MKKKLTSIMASIFEVDPSVINENTSPDSLETWDSINHMNLIQALEEQFEVNFSDKEVVDMMNFKVVELILKEKLPAK
jgi:acyl carrier protein